MIMRDHAIRAIQRELQRGSRQVGYLQIAQADQAAVQKSASQTTPSATTITEKAAESFHIDFLFLYDAKSRNIELVTKMAEALKISTERYKIIAIQKKASKEYEESLAKGVRFLVNLDVFTTVQLAGHPKIGDVIQSVSPDELAISPTKKREIWSQLQAALKTLA